MKIMNNTENISYFANGEPATFATKREKPWKKNLIQQIPDGNQIGSEKGIVLDFHLKSMKVNKQYFDVDNLCEPVFSIMINSKGWFNGKRPNIKWFRASKIKDIKSGCNIIISDSLEPETEVIYKNIIYDRIYSGNLPRSATDNEFITWVLEKTIKDYKCTSIYLKIEFASSKINLGDIATGKVKSIIDCLYPIIGGNIGNPEDWKVNILEVHKGVKTIPDETIKVFIADL